MAEHDVVAGGRLTDRVSLGVRDGSQKLSRSWTTNLSAGSLADPHTSAQVKT